MAGTVACDPGWYSLSARVTFSTFSGGPIRTSTPDMEFDAWYAVGTAPSGSQMTVVVRCVPAANMSNARLASHSVAIGSNNADAWATCPEGMAPTVGGTLQDSGSGAVTTQPQPYLPTRRWASQTYGGTGTMRTNVVCIPSQPPTVSVSNGTPTPSPNSSAATWTFSAHDPAASGGYTLSAQCSLNGGGFTPCASPVQYGGLADGTHTLDVRAITSDGRLSTVHRRTVRIDTTAPVLQFLGPVLHADDEPTVRVHVADADASVGFRCAVDGAPEVMCGGVQVFGGAATTTLRWSGSMTDGPHVVRVTATDGRGNAVVGDRAFTVDTRAPTVAQRTPAKPFTVKPAVTVSWSGSDGTSGVASYAVRWQRAAVTDAGFGPWTTVAVPGTASSRRFTGLLRGATYCFSVRAVDHAGHASPWTGARCTAIALDDRDLARSSGWRAQTPTGWLRRTALVTTTKGATLSLTGARLKRVALVAQKCRTCGVVRISAGGRRVGTIDLTSRTTARRTVVLPTFSERTGTVTVRVLSSGKRVQIDALGVSRR
ncbi:fibronectin type III domain-containing protein [Nocardioides sp.]|uniref:fibronectin type III domain-containing protein n=1 Tax=Nocardioides sp. TaxID=35761 RepID=UPI002733373F|nr:fibronectin type III domain-containing protein [Nocardioides sp.]MDP3892002.1 fibronectin type III domain-containing protein [Nocardioides sp.]